MISVMDYDERIKKDTVNSDGDITKTTFRTDFVVDTAAEVSNLPDDCPAGSTAIVAATGDTYISDSTGAWKQLS